MSCFNITGEVGIYLTVYDAKSTDEKSIGLEHYFRMHTTELLYEEFSKTDTVDIRATLVKRKILDEMYIDRFEQGTFLNMS